MDWKASPPAIEIAVASIAAACLGGATGFAVAHVAPFGAGLLVATAAGVLVSLAAWLLLGWLGRGALSAPAESLADLLLVEDVLLLDKRVDDDQVLLLDDPLPALDDQSRVVRLFAAQPAATSESTPFAGPGEMIARIEDFLGHARGSAAAGEQSIPDRAAAEDASAALHAALAEIRRSLRQG